MNLHIVAPDRHYVLATYVATYHAQMRAKSNENNLAKTCDLTNEMADSRAVGWYWQTETMERRVAVES